MSFTVGILFKRLLRSNVMELYFGLTLDYMDIRSDSFMDSRVLEPMSIAPCSNVLRSR